MYRLRGVALPSEESVSLWVDASGLLSDEPITGAELLVDGGWILPGLDQLPADFDLSKLKFPKGK